jgi:hypothetical protein
MVLLATLFAYLLMLIHYYFIIFCEIWLPSSNPKHIFINNMVFWVTGPCSSKEDEHAASVTSGFFRTTRHYNPGDRSLHSNSCENLKSNIYYYPLYDWNINCKVILQFTDTQFIPIYFRSILCHVEGCQQLR